jgi:AcrR family transcriptional regulator
MAAKRRPSRRSDGRQAAKSAATRQAAIEGAVDCFVRLGYARSSTIEISKRARVSRGAMIYHFPTKRKLLEATVEYIISERIRRFTTDMHSTVRSEEDRLSQRGIDIYWKHLNSRLFTAFHELVTASRTDATLARVLKAATARFDKVWYQAVQDLFPEWRGKEALLGLALDLTRFLLEGMALNKMSHDARQRRQRIRDYLKSRLRDILQAGDRQDSDTAVREFLRNATVGK